MENCGRWSLLIVLLLSRFLCSSTGDTVVSKTEGVSILFIFLADTTTTPRFD